MQELGLSIPTSWPSTLAWAMTWLALLLAYSPVADHIATRLVAKPPTLSAFRVLQHSRSKLIIGIVVAWLLGGLLEELVLRGIVLQATRALLSAWLSRPPATAIAVCVAALAAGLIHTYQGRRAALIIAQLSVLFGLLFVASNYNLWAVILCHGLYDTIAFIRFAHKQSRYSRSGAES
jgi:membrane protease YdiL (CAAX protease family)